MGKFSWTEEQERAISFRGGAAIVSAAAGSGKTAVLVERIMRMLTDKEEPVPADQLVVSTFTQKAAAELKQRLDSALSSALAADPENELLNDQLMRLSDASISTISALCLSILKKNSALLDVSPELSVLDSSEAELIFSAALSDTLEDFCENAPDKDKDLLYGWFGGEDDKRIEDALRYLYNFSTSLVEPEKFFRSQLEIYSSPEKFPDDILKKYEKLTLEKAYKTLSQMCEDLKTQCSNTPAESFALQWEQLVGLCTDAEKLYSTANGMKQPTLPRKTKDFDNTEIKELRDDMKEIFDDAVQCAGLIMRKNDDLKACAPVLVILTELLDRLTERYSAAKREKGRIDFADMERMTLKLLRNNNGEQSVTAKELSQNIAEIIVDEFQDSNEIQYEIFRLLSKNKKNLYFVGDIKQSIYRFRGADPLVFARLCEDKDFTVIGLNRNFRSNSSVINFVNALFTGTMTKDNGDVEYNEKHALVQGAKYEDCPENKPEMICFMGADKAKSRESEAAYIADRIKGMVLSGFQVTRDGKKYPCRYKDFAVLMRSYSSNISIYKNAFTKAGIPFDAKEDDGYTDLSEIRLALSLLRVIDDPYKDSDLAAVMMSPPYLFTADEMAAIKLKGTGKHKNLWTGLCAYAEKDPKAKKFLDEINYYRDFSSENSVHSLVRKIYDESLMIPATAASPNGERRDMNLRMLIRLAGSFSDADSAGLYDFIKYMESIDRNNIRLAEAKSGGKSSDSVKIMTIHGSKGLEFPICFISNVTTDSKTKEAGSIIACEPSAGIGMRVIDSERLLNINTMMFDMVSRENQRLDMSEEVRLLYVAATRAKEKLIFTVPVAPKTPEKMHYGLIKNSAAVIKGYIDTSTVDSYTPNEADSAVQLLQKYADIPEFTEYAHIPFTKIPSKVTATQIGVKSATDFDEITDSIDRYLRVPSFLKGEEKKLTGKKRGDAYHKVMELLDFGSGESALKQLDGLLTRGKITQTERLSIDEAEIQGFLDSDICARAVKSGRIFKEYPIFCEYLPNEGEYGVKDWENEEKPFIQGIADMFFIEDDGIVLVDYKTNRGLTPEQLADEYRGQLEVYSAALTEALGLAVKQKVLYSFSLGVVET